MELVEGRPNIELRSNQLGEGREVVLAFPYDAAIVDAVRKIPGRRFDWDAREWIAPVDEWVGVHVLDVLERFPELVPSEEATSWLDDLARSWIGTVSTVAHDGRGWFTLTARAGALPDGLADRTLPERPDVHLAPLTVQAADAIMELGAAKIDSAASRCMSRLRMGEQPAPAELRVTHGVEGLALKLDVLWDPDAGRAWDGLPGAGDRSRSLPADPYVAEELDAFLVRHRVEVTPTAQPVLEELRRDAAEAKTMVVRSKAREAEPLPEVAARLGGELQPFQWAGVREALDRRRMFLADEQGLGKTVQALATLEADDAWPAVVVCPASLKLTWAREAARWLPHREVQVIDGRGAAIRTGELTILNYEVVAAHREALARRRPRALVLDESHYCKNPQAKRTQAVRKLAKAVPEGGLKLALSGTPVMNHAEELIPQLRILDRLQDFGSGARFSREFRGDDGDERLHWHLRRRCFVRRLKAEVLPQLPAKTTAVVPMGLANEQEYRLAEKDVVEWLRQQPLDLSELDAKIAATLRAERLAQVGTLKRLAAKGKLPTALAWVHDFLQSGEPLVLFCHHREVAEEVLQRFPDALHLLGRDSQAARDAAVRAFQEPDGPQLIVCATRVAGQGLTLTRASNVAFLELEWTPAAHDQAEDRCHRIGQHDAVTAWYLLADGTIDETISRLLARKRGIVGAVTDGRADEGEALIDSVVRELRGETYRHLRPVA